MSAEDEIAKAREQIAASRPITPPRVEVPTRCTAADCIRGYGHTGPHLPPMDEDGEA